MDLTTSQTRNINDGDFKKLEKLIQAKQTQINCIEPLDERLNTIFLKLKDKLNIESMEQLNNKSVRGIRELKEETSKTLEIITEISLIEKQNNEMMLKLMEQNKREIKNIAHGKKAVSAYTHHSSDVPSYYIDKKK